METWPCSLVFNIALRQLSSNTFNFLVSSCLRYHVSEPMYRRRFKFTETSLRDHTIFSNLPNALLANAILLFALSDEFGTSDHKKLNSLTISIFSFYIVTLEILSEVRDNFAFFSIDLHSILFTGFL